VIFEKKESLKEILSHYPNINISSIKIYDDYAPKDFIEFQNGLNSEEYNLLLYSEILDFLQKDYSYVNKEFVDIWQKEELDNLSVKSFFNNVINKLLFYYATKKKIIIYSLFNRKKDELSFFFKNYKLLGLIFRHLPILKRGNINSAIRYENIKISCTDQRHKNFYTLLNRILWKNIPIVHIENYQFLKNQLSQLFSSKTQILASANGWKSDEKFKIIAANLSEKGCKLVGAQHGGNTGITSHSYVETHILDVVERYFIFGSISSESYPEFRNKIKKIQFPKLINTNSNSSNVNSILFLGTSYSNYFCHYRYGPIKNNILSYKQFQAELIQTLSNTYKEKIIIRTPGKFDLIDLVNSNRNIEYDNMSKKLEDVVKDANLVIVDNINTTFTQCLLLNIPTILVINPKVWNFATDFSQVAKLLEDSGILFYDVNKATERAIAITIDESLWFNNIAIHEAIDVYLKKYTSNNNKWENTWLNELESLLRSEL
jgi:putative transferase (TIGR04331 family)